MKSGQGLGSANGRKKKGFEGNGVNKIWAVIEV